MGRGTTKEQYLGGGALGEEDVLNMGRGKRCSGIVMHTRQKMSSEKRGEGEIIGAKDDDEEGGVWKVV